METTKIDSIKLVRHIRDQIAADLHDKTPEEIIAYYQHNAKQLHNRLGRPLNGQSSTHGNVQQPLPSNPKQ